ncbi:hypothetical protein [Baaleninema sp.]
MTGKALEEAITADRGAIAGFDRRESATRSSDRPAFAQQFQ